MTTPQELVSIIILNHNGKTFLAKCLESVLKLEYKKKEIIFVDNASTDGSVDFVQKKYSQIKIVENKIGLGFAGGNLSGIKQAKGEYILLVSNDTWVPHDMLTRLYNYFTRHNAEVVAPYEGEYAGTKRTPYASLIDPFGHHIYLYGSDKEPFYLTGVCLFFKKNFYLETQGMDPDFFLYTEDVDWFWRLILFNKKFTYVKGAYIFHAGAGSSGGSQDKMIKEGIFKMRNRNTLYMLLKNYSTLSLWIILPMHLVINIAEMIFFLILGKPQVAKTYIDGWMYILNKWDEIKPKRDWIQKKRKVSDFEVLKRMHIGLAKLYHLYTFFIKKP